MDVDPFYIHHQNKQKKRQQFKPVLRVLVEGLASLIEGQRCFAEEFGLSYGRVFHDDLDSFRGNDTCKVISRWIRDGEAGATNLKKLFDDLAQHQMALLEAANEVASESIAKSKSRKNKFANYLGMETKEYLSKYMTDQELHKALHQHLFLTAFISGYAKSREQMKSGQGPVYPLFESDKAVS
ncbi:MAG: hypothetical protein KZQ93_05110 [Candidatus Thiodiazotropha sp. (ex Monitilora ramsayi)]|nr:hypothetical protein [Candidatus Thiodiazotropha sp. (ex Monitilora ramsayi)]